MNGAVHVLPQGQAKADEPAPRSVYLDAYLGPFRQWLDLRR